MPGPAATQAGDSAASWLAQRLSSATSNSAGCRRSSCASSSSPLVRLARRGTGRRQDPAMPGPAFAGCGHRRHQGVAAFFQQGFVGHRARRDDAHHFPINRAFAGGRVAGLLADGRRLAFANQPRQVAVDRVMGHARHGYGLAVGFTAGGQGDIQQAGRAARIVIKKLVKIAHAEQQQGVRKLAFDAQILLHQGGVPGVGFGGWR